MRDIEVLQAQLRYLHQQLETCSMMHKVFFKDANFSMSTKYSDKKETLKRQINQKLDILFDLLPPTHFN